MRRRAPPFDYDWPAHGDIPHVHLGPQDLTLDLPRGASEASYRNVLRVFGWLSKLMVTLHVARRHSLRRL